ncbi:MAG: flagellar hook-basal body complex protein FliE [Cyanobacteria bacterium]|nr:flagellar hook-basal body complex protein FliE [Cyanobacteriota bacterium]MDA1021184.1 flagellar hook-basal body complex protein FliE [Cyanobacteriota bacterium]
MQNYGQLPQMPTMPGAQKLLHGHISVGDKVNGASFGDTVSQMLNKANNIMGEPEKLSIEAVKTGNVDIHEVMIALGKSGVAFKLITAMTQKVVGAFDKLSSMQV